MSQTKAQRKKQQKTRDREKKIKRMRNIQRNAPDKRFRLDVSLDGAWREGVRSWSYAWQVEAHKTETEARRLKGEEIAAGRVIDLNSGAVILTIPGSKPKGTAPDKIADGTKAIC